MTSRFQFIAYIATWLAGDGSIIIENGLVLSVNWGGTLNITGLVTSMFVNALVTGLIVFKILEVFLEVNAASGSLSSTGGPKLQHIIFIIIESAMALFAIQLVRVVFASLVKI